jgi:formate/nitrite transporter FocA (FNT family)/protein-disulfide isomerase
MDRAENGEMREVLDRSESGAPAAGHAVRDLFSTDEIFQRVVATADEEFSRSARLLFLSGVAAGLSIGLSFVARASLTAATGSTDPSGLIGTLLYPLGFLLIVQGRYQLFTENTLTPVTLVLTRIASLPALLRVWGIVLVANVVGAGALAYVLATTGVFNPDTAEVARYFGEHALETSWTDLFWKGVIAGWIVASMVWLIHAARDSITRFATVFVLMVLIPVADLFHCIIGACEVLYLAFQGLAGWGACASFFVAVAFGNTVGGVLLVAVLNFAQTRDQRFRDRDCGQLELTWREWFFGRYAGFPGELRDQMLGDAQPAAASDAALDPPVDETRDHIHGPDDAPITLVQYGDYECPTSRQVYLLAQRVTTHHDDNVRYVWRHLPLSRQHPHAERAACAAEAAGAQGAYWAMHDELFQHQDHLEDETLVACAEKLDLDMDRFRADLESDTAHSRVLEDRRFGIRSGVRSTRNLFIGSTRYDGAWSTEAIEAAIGAQQAAAEETA